MGLPDDFFDNPNLDKTIFSKKGSFPDLNATWQRATWPITDFEIDWKRYEGWRHSAVRFPLLQNNSILW